LTPCCCSYCHSHSYSCCCCCFHSCCCSYSCCHSHLCCCSCCCIIMSVITQLKVSIDNTEYVFWLEVQKILDNWAIKNKFSFWVVKKKPVRATYCCKNKNCSWRCWVWKNLNEMLILTIIETEHNCIETELKKRRTVSSHV